MELSAFTSSLARRWYLVVVALALTAAATVLTVGRVGPSYVSQGTVLLLPPVTSLQVDGEPITDGNPYLFLAGLNPARDIMVRQLTSRTQRDSLTDAYPGADYEVTPDVSTSGPMIVIQVAGRTAAESTSALDELMGRVPVVLTRLQEEQGIGSRARIETQVITSDPRPTVERRDQIRAGVAVAGGLLAASLLGIGLIDALLSARRARRAEARATQEDGPAHDDDPEPEPARSSDPAGPARTDPSDPAGPARTGRGRADGHLHSAALPAKRSPATRRLRR